MSPNGVEMVIGTNHVETPDNSVPITGQVRGDPRQNHPDQAGTSMAFGTQRMDAVAAAASALSPRANVSPSASTTLKGFTTPSLVNSLQRTVAAERAAAAALPCANRSSSAILAVEEQGTPRRNGDQRGNHDLLPEAVAA